MRISDLKISISGIRGIVGQSLTPQLIIKFSEAFSNYIGGGSIAVASDTRPSAEMVKKAVFAGVLSGGGSPFDLGILPIPSLQIYVKENKFRGGISVTASHNPVEWNALKLIKRGGYFLNPYEAEELLDFYYQGRFRRTAAPEKVQIEPDPFSLHTHKIRSFIDIDAVKNRRPRVVVDPCGGAAAPYVKPYLEQLGAEVECIHCGISGAFPRSPEPVAENLDALCRAVKSSGADIGFAQDADADRLAVVDEKGRAVGEEYTLAIAVDYFLQYKKESPVTVNLSTSRVIEDITKKHKVGLIRTKVGEINVARGMLEAGAKIGGEGNGGIMAADIHACRDSFTGMALFLECLAKSKMTVSRLRDRLPDYFMSKDKIRASFRDRKRILNRIQNEFRDGHINTLDGLRIDYPDFWIHVRPSNTEPVVRIIIEGSDKQTVQNLSKRIKEDI